MFQLFNDEDRGRRSGWGWWRIVHVHFSFEHVRCLFWLIVTNLFWKWILHFASRFGVEPDMNSLTYNPYSRFNLSNKTLVSNDDCCIRGEKFKPFTFTNHRSLSNSHSFIYIFWFSPSSHRSDRRQSVDKMNTNEARGGARFGASQILTLLVVWVCVKQMGTVPWTAGWCSIEILGIIVWFICLARPYLAGGLEHVLFFHILGIMIPTD